MKRLIAWMLCAVMVLSAALWSAWAEDDDTEDVAGLITYEAGDAVGDVVNADAPQPSDQALNAFGLTPLDVALVIDSSGSMQASSRHGKQIISYAQDAAVYFVQTLASLNPYSRVGIVQYDTYPSVVSNPLPIERNNELSASIRSIELGNMTNTAGGFDTARSMLDQYSRPDARRMILLLTDGLANEGRNPIDAGWDAAGNNTLVYTVGLVGALSSSEKAEARRVLAAGYETRYFEIDFSNVNDINTQLADAFMTIAIGASVSADREDALSGAYRLSISSGLDVYVSDGSGEYLCSSPLDYRGSAAFGYMALLGDNMDEKTMVLRDGDYSIRLRSTGSTRASYSITRLQGSRASETGLLRRTDDFNPTLVRCIHLHGNQADVTDEIWNPLDMQAIDPFTGQLTRGLEMPVTAKLADQANVRSLPDKNSLLIQAINGGTVVSVLAQDPDTSWYFISFIDENNLLSRGWLPRSALTPSGFVPSMVWARASQFQLPEGTMNRRAPAATAAPASSFRQTISVTVLHAERDASGREWVYLRAEGQSKAEALYVPADQIPGWKPITPRGYRLGYGTPTFVFRRQLGGNGFTEIMWVAPQSDMSGTVLSGRTSSTQGELVARAGDRDSMAIRMDSFGNYENISVVGGSGWDSYHCILPDQTGFFVAGVTRSNDKDFAGIWDTQTYYGRTMSKTDRTNALLGRLDEDFNIRWMRSFGVGSPSFGFDVVIPLADGTVAGCGWLNLTDSFALSGYGRQDFLVVKMSADGQLINLANFGGSGDDIPDSAAATPDSGLIMVGSTYQNNNGDGLIVIVDQNLNLVKRLVYGGMGEDIFDNIRDLGNGTYLVTGFTESGARGGHDFWAMVIDSTGRMVWSKTYGGSQDEELCGTTILPGNRYLLVGSTMSRDGDVVGSRGRNGEKDAWVICIDESGRLLWQFTSDLPGNDSFNAAAMDFADNTIVLGGLCRRNSDQDAKGYIVKITAP